MAKPKFTKEGDEASSGRMAPEDINLGKLPSYAGTYLRLFSLILNSGTDEALIDHPIGPGQGKMSTLQVIARTPGISQIELSDIFGRDRSTQFRIIVDLEKRGLVRRELDPNERRRKKLFVTEFGQSLISGIEEITARNEARLFGALSEREYSHLRKLLAKLWKSKLGQNSDYWPDPK